MSESEFEKFTGDTPNAIISPGGSDAGEISNLNARVKRTWATIIWHFSSRKQRVREVIPVPDSLGKETTFIGPYTSRWKLKCLGVTISTTPSLWDKDIL